MKQVPLTQGRCSVVDDDMLDALLKHRWHLTHYGYAATWDGPSRRILLMHRLILDAGDGTEVDHRNGDKLDNRRANLRSSDRVGNQRNTLKRRITATSRYKGVSWDEANLRWRAVIVVDGTQQSLGRHHGEKDAARAYDIAARRLFGSYARLNFPEGDEESALPRGLVAP